MNIRFSKEYFDSKVRALIKYASTPRYQRESRSYGTFIFLIFVAFAIYLVLSHLGPDAALDVLSPLSMLFIAVAIAQIAISTKLPKTEDKEGNFVLLWIRAVVNKGLASLFNVYFVGFAALMLILFSGIATDPEFGMFMIVVFPIFFFVLTYAIARMLSLPSIFENFKLTKKRLTPPLLAIAFLLAWFAIFPLLIPDAASDRFKPFMFTISAYAVLAYTCFADWKVAGYLGLDF